MTAKTATNGCRAAAGVVLLLLLLLLLAPGCAATGAGDTDADRPGYLAAGPTVGLGEPEKKPSVLELLDARNRELLAARTEAERLEGENARLEARFAALSAEIAEHSKRADAAERERDELRVEARALREALVRSRLDNVRLGQLLVRLRMETEGEPPDLEPGN